jgi:hypothetical protein
MLQRQLEDDRRIWSQKLESEAKQKTRWKDRYFEEHDKLQLSIKEVSDLTSKIAELKAEKMVSDRSLLDLKDQRDMQKDLRD